ncbi:hypothetical protein UFOVP116_42 [uncultured Caudovirales phage]|uniref:Uncharacterized protein n=1 Tax=uncultured Caudovirales phage TaxID=2100421 RepID=A0A6J5L4A4_9CAUD|nr:hypothetical protein UFOVP116_42 [uncultured Caudovirales phage]
MTNKEPLATLVERGGNCVNLGRTVKAQFPELWRWVINNTRFLDARISTAPVRDTERIYCLINGITTIPMHVRGGPAPYTNFFQGYRTGEKLQAKQIKAQEEIAAKAAVRASQPPKSAPLTKIEEFIKRNRKRNAHLYQDGTVENIDYVVCPVTGERRSMITEPYVSKILGLTMEQFKTQYPTALLMTPSHIENVKSGLKEIDAATGLTKHELAKQKSMVTLSTVDPETGLCGYDRLGQKTRATHMSKVDEFGRNGYQRQAHGRVTTVMENGLTVEQNAHIKQHQTMIERGVSGSGGASKISKEVLAPIIELLSQNNIKYHFDMREYGIYDPDSMRYYFWDLTVPVFNLAAEYQSHAWHADPRMTAEEWDKWQVPKGKPRTATEMLEYDYTKARALFKHRGIVTYYVWERTREDDVKDILCLLKTLIMK